MVIPEFAGLATSPLKRVPPCWEQVGVKPCGPTLDVTASVAKSAAAAQLPGGGPASIGLLLARFTGLCPKPLFKTYPKASPLPLKLC